MPQQMHNACHAHTHTITHTHTRTHTPTPKQTQLQHKTKWRQRQNFLFCNSLSLQPSQILLPAVNDSDDNDVSNNDVDNEDNNQLVEFIRQDSLRSEYLSDRESRYGIVQQASIESTDSRMCYLTSSEVSFIFKTWKC